MSSIWITLLLWAVGKLIAWLTVKSYGPDSLSAEERNKLDGVLAKTRELDRLAVGMGCTPPAGRPADYSF